METQRHGPERRGTAASNKARRTRSTPDAAAVSDESALIQVGTDGAHEHALLIGRFSHDVRGALGAADGYAQLLQLRLGGPLSEDQERDVARIRALLRTATELVNDVVYVMQERIRMETPRRAG